MSNSSVVIKSTDAVIDLLQSGLPNRRRGCGAQVAGLGGQRRLSAPGGCLSWGLWGF